MIKAEVVWLVFLRLQEFKISIKERISPHLLLILILSLDCTVNNRHLNEAVTTISSVSNFFLDNSPKKLNFLDKVYKVF